MMRIESMRDYAGLTPGLPQPCVCVVLSDAGEAVPPLLWSQLGGLLAHRLKPGSLIDESPSLAQALGAVVVALQRAQGLPMLAAAKVQPDDGGGSRLVLRVPTLPTVHPLTRGLLGALVTLVVACIEGADAAAALSQLDLWLRRLSVHALAGKNRLPILEAAQRAGVPWERLGTQLYRLGHGARSRWFDSSLTDRTPALSVALAREKHRTAALLRRQGLPVPRQHLARGEDDAVAAARALGFPVVVKPADLDRGIGVRARLRTEAAVRAAYRQARQHSAQVLVEQQIVGEDHRFHVFDDQVYRVRHRVPGGVVGDGVSTVRQLLQVLNADPQRGPPDGGAELVRIALDDEAFAMLDEQGLQMDAVVEVGRPVALRAIANVSAGGISLPVPLHEVHPDNLLLAVRAVRTLGLDLAAVDMLIPDVRRSWMDVGGGICEVNAKPQFGDGAPEHILGALFPDQGRIPIVMVIGALDLGWFSALREQALAAGVRLGVSDASGLWCGAARLAAPLAGGAYRGCEVLLGERDVDAVLVHADASLTRQGLPSDRIDALVLADATGEGQRTELLHWLAPASHRRWLLAPGAGWDDLSDAAWIRGATVLAPQALHAATLKVLLARH